MSSATNARELTDLKESGSSMRSNRVFEELFASVANASEADFAGSLQEFRNLLVGLKLRLEAIAEDKRDTAEAVQASEGRIANLRQQLDTKAQELETLKGKYQTEEKIVRLAQESFDQPQWINIDGHEIRMVLNRTQTDLAEDKRVLEQEVSELEEEMQKENHELKRRLELTNATLSAVSELRSKIEMPREQREQIFGRDEDDPTERASDDDESELRIKAKSELDTGKDADRGVESEAEKGTDKELKGDDEMIYDDDDDEAVSA